MNIFKFLARQLPVLVEKYQSPSSPDLIIRKKEKLNFEEKSEFEKFININFFNHIPKCYLEDFKFIDRLINESAIPQKNQKFYYLQRQFYLMTFLQEFVLVKKN